jgi:hypothetical protein
MKAWTIKHPGKIWKGTMIYIDEITDKDGNEHIYTGILFFRKKDAKNYLKWNNIEHLEIVSVEIGKCK